ncbi:MAG: hypothetical protein AB7H96_21260 [Vicinamibacterales bacterium]
MAGASKVRDTWPASGACYLCGACGPLCRSHIIPKFVGEWLKASNATGRLRDSAAPNRLIEDLPWRYMLCNDCEERFSRVEAETRMRIFVPLHEHEQVAFRYGPAFVQFAVSVLWRCLVFLRVEGRLGKLGDLPESAAAERVWRGFLLGQGRTVAPHDVHAFHMDAPPPQPHLQGLPPNLGRYMLRSVGMSALQRDDFGYVFVKIARINIFGTVVSGSQRKLWKNSKLHASGGSWGGVDVGTPSWVPSVFIDGAELGEAMFDGLSPQQKGKTNAKLLAAAQADPKSFRETGAMRALRTDLNRVGKKAFQKPFE